MDEEAREGAVEIAMAAVTSAVDELYALRLTSLPGGS